MLKCHLDSTTNTCSITVKGNLISILSDLSYLIHDIYLACQRNDYIAGCSFKYELQRIVDDNSSPIWKASDTNEDEKRAVKDVRVHIPKAMRDLLDDLRESEHGE